MMLPHVDDVRELAKGRGMPDEIVEELVRLAKGRETRRLALVDGTEDSVSLADETNDRVREETLWSLYRDRAAAIHWPWERLQAVIGSMVRGDVHIVGARTGVGKTTFLLNVVNALASTLRSGSVVKVIPFETAPSKMVKILAAIRTGYDPRHVLRDEWDRLPDSAFSDIDSECRLITSRVWADRLLWTPQGTLNVGQVLVELERAADCGVNVVVIDHLHRIETDGRQPEQELRRMMRALKDKAEKLELVLLCGAQLNRGERDALKRYLPPLETDLRGSGALEEESDGILGLYLPLRPDVTAKQMAAVRNGLASAKDLMRRSQTGIRVLKHRIDGALVGADVFLDYHHGRMSDPEPRVSTWEP